MSMYVCEYGKIEKRGEGSKQTMRSLDNITKTKGDDRDKEINRKDSTTDDVPNKECRERQKLYEYRSVRFAGWTGY